MIDLPRDRVVVLFDDPENLLKWQRNLTSLENLEGEPGKVGLKRRLVYDQGGCTMEMVETVLKHSLPDELSVLYETENVKNWIVNRFYVEGGARTRWLMESKFEFAGEMAAMAAETPDAFTEQTRQAMVLFKAFAEAQG